MVLIALVATARADEPSEPEAELPSPEKIRAARIFHGIARLAEIHADHAESRDEQRLAIGIMVAARLAAANLPTGTRTSWSVTLGGGAERIDGAQTERALGEVAIAGRATVEKAGCPLLDSAAQLIVASTGDASATGLAEICLQGFHPSDTGGLDPHDFDLVATSAFASVGWNVRPALDGAAVLDSTRFSIARAGLATEGARYHVTPRWSLAGPWARLTTGYLRQRVGMEARTLEEAGMAAWIFEARYARPRSITDTAFQFLLFDAEQVLGGEEVGTFGITPGGVVGLGTHGVYVDASGGIHFTSGQSDVEPTVFAGTWRLALRIGAPELNAQLVAHRRLLPTVGGAVLVENRESAQLSAALGPLVARGEAYRAHNEIYVDGDGTMDRELASWGVDAALWLRLGRHWLLGATLDVGRSFVFAEPSADPRMPADPQFGFRALASIGWQR